MGSRRFEPGIKKDRKSKASHKFKKNQKKMMSKFKENVLHNDLRFVEQTEVGFEELNQCDRFGRNLLFDCISNGMIEMSSLLISKCINLNKKDSDGKTPLHFCAIHSQPTIALNLLEKNAQVDITDNYGNTPLSDAVFESKGKEELIVLLLRFGANPDYENNYGVSPKNLAKTIANYKLTHLFEK